MKPSKIIIAIITAGLFAASCGLFYNPDFADKIGVGNSGAQFTGADGDVIGPGTGSISGTIKSYLKTSDLTASIDGSNYTVNFKYPDWTIPLTSLPCGPHSVKLILKGTDGKDAETKSFTYNVPAYVATNGSDGNAGNHPTNAFRSIQKGADVLTNLTGTRYVYVGEGTYSPVVNGGLNTNGAGVLLQNGPVIYNNISISGGWSSGFQNNNGKSILDENPSANDVIHINGVTNMNINNFTIKNGSNGIFTGSGTMLISLSNLIIESNTTGVNFNGISNNINALIRNNNNTNGDGSGININSSGARYSIINGTIVSNRSSGYGGGIVISGAASSITVNASVTWNTAGTTGGGIWINSSHNNVINSTVAWNDAGDSGGGIYISGFSSGNIINGSVGNNSAATNGGGIYIEYSSDNIISSSAVISGNTANSGGGVYMTVCSNNSINAVINNNEALNFAGGFYFTASGGNTVSGTVSGNTANSAGGLYFTASSGNTVSGTVSGNTATNSTGGGLYLYSSSSNTISGTVSGNTATNSSGGGLYLYSSSYNTVSGAVSGNTAAWGGGLYLDSSSYNTISNTVSGNTASGNGGGFDFAQSSFNTILGTISYNTNYGVATNTGSSNNYFDTGKMNHNTPGNFTNF